MLVKQNVCLSRLLSYIAELAGLQMTSKVSELYRQKCETRCVIHFLGAGSRLFRAGAEPSPTGGRGGTAR